MPSPTNKGAKRGRPLGSGITPDGQGRDLLHFQGDWRNWPGELINAWWETHSDCRKRTRFGYAAADPECLKIVAEKALKHGERPP